MKITLSETFLSRFISKISLHSNAVALALRVAFLLVMTAVSSRGAESIVLDYGPQTGLLTPPEGGSSVFVNGSGFQNFADAIKFPTDTTIVGYNLFTASSHLVPYINTFCVRLWSDNAGKPGTLITELDLTSDHVQFVGNFQTTTHTQTDVYQISLS